MTWTKEQQRVYHRAWTERNRARVNAAQAKWRAENREKQNARVAVFNVLRGKEYSARYRAKHPERRKTSTRKYRLANIAAEQRYRKMYVSKNLDRLALKSAHRRALKLRATPNWYEADLVANVYLAGQLRGLHVDHMVPLKSPLVCGLHCLANLQTLSGPENLSKGNRWWPDMWPSIK
jgi:hypothetical protein